MIEWQAIITILGWVFLAAGAFFSFTAAIGLFRLPDFYTRLHAAGVIDSIGAPMSILGMALLVWQAAVSIKLVLLMVFILATAPTACHALIKAAVGNRKGKT